MTTCWPRVGPGHTPHQTCYTSGGGKGVEGSDYKLELIGCPHCCCRYVDPVMATGWHMLLGGLPLAALSLAREGSELAPRLQQLTGQHLMLVTHLNVCLKNIQSAALWATCALKITSTQLGSTLHSCGCIGVLSTLSCLITACTCHGTRAICE